MTKFWMPLTDSYHDFWQYIKYSDTYTSDEILERNNLYESEATSYVHGREDEIQKSF